MPGYLHEIFRFYLIYIFKQSSMVKWAVYSILRIAKSPLFSFSRNLYESFGQSIGPLLSFYKLKPENLLVVHDELELPLGTVSLKWAGGLGGHNGLRSTKECLGTADFWRLRLGIGRPVHGDVSNWVLSDFTDDESIILGQVFAQMDDFFCNCLQKSRKSRKNGRNKTCWSEVFRLGKRNRF